MTDSTPTAREAVQKALDETRSLGREVFKGSSNRTMEALEWFYAEMSLRSYSVLPTAQQGEPANPYPEGSPREAWRRGYNGETNFGAKGSDYDRQYHEGKRARSAAPAPQAQQEGDAV